MEEGKRAYFPLFRGLPSLITRRSMKKALVMGERPERFAVYLSALAAFLGFRVLVADGANTFDPYLISRFARRENLSPPTLLKKIFVARAFTCHQFVTLIREHLEPLLCPETYSLVVLLGPGNMFFDEDVPGEEAVFLFRQILAQINKMVGEKVFFLLSQSRRGINQRRIFLLRELYRVADVVLNLKPAAEDLQIIFAKPPLTLPRPWEVFEEFKRLAVSGESPEELY